jgi:hypothetical protein
MDIGACVVSRLFRARLAKLARRQSKRKYQVRLCGERTLMHAQSPSTIQDPLTGNEIGVLTCASKDFVFFWPGKSAVYCGT